MVFFSVNFIIGHLGETYEAALDSVKFAEHIAQKFQNSYVNFHNMVPFPGTELYSYIKQHGRFTMPEDKVLTEAATLSGEPLFETDDFTKAQRKEVLEKGLRLTRKTHLMCRFGRLKGRIVHTLFGNSLMYSFGRKFVMGSGLGRKMFNALRK